MLLHGGHFQTWTKGRVSTDNNNKYVEGRYKDDTDT